MLALSIGLMALSFLTAFLLLPPLILLPLACFCGYKAYKASRQKNPRQSRFQRVLSLVPMVLPAALFFLFIYLINTQYKV